MSGPMPHTVQSSSRPVIYDFQDSRSGRHAARSSERLAGLRSVMITVVIKHALNQARSLGGWAWHARKFHELHVTGKTR